MNPNTFVGTVEIMTVLLIFWVCIMFASAVRDVKREEARARRNAIYHKGPPGPEYMALIAELRAKVEAERGRR